MMEKFDLKFYVTKIINLFRLNKNKIYICKKLLRINLNNEIKNYYHFFFIVYLLGIFAGKS
ncbi:hypothetical protein GCM10023230_26960 [Flavobacterium hankyongi]|uniref:Uncharacterized protein n=1 Tax=Flavobacterium hankyongi TaxID=1176532 RepID=A0ABP9A8Z5_9FLAO